MNPIPKELTSALLSWYKREKRILPWRENTDPYRVWVSEIMLQQTRVDAVIPYYHRFMERFPTLTDLADAPEEEVLKLWEGLGYYSRAKNLQKGARMVLTEYGGVIPADYQELQKIPGIGEYVAGAISSIAYGLPNPAVDGNVLRIIARITESCDDVMKGAVRREVFRGLQEIYPPNEAGDFTQALMELGAIRCLPNGAPLCTSCPAAAFCKAYAHNTWAQLPKKPPKKERKKEKRTVFLLKKGEAWAIQKRPESGLLASLWEFPATAGHLTTKEAKAYLEHEGLTITSIAPCGSAKHIFSHVEWHMKGYLCEAEGEGNLAWVTARELEEKYTLPSAMKYYYNVIKEHEA